MTAMRKLAYRPEELSSFIGRSSEISELSQLMRTMRAVTLCGAGGIGKTRLAARLLAAIAGDFPDGAWFVELGDVRDSERLTDFVAAAVGVREEPGQPLAVTLAEALRHRNAIIVLDNCEHLITECARLCQQLLARSPGLKIMATSREPLRMAAEAVWQVPPLAVPSGSVGAAEMVRDYDAVTLFAERASAAAPGFALTAANANTVAGICRALDGLPLAVELAAAWARVLSVEQIAARVHRRLGLLTSTDRGVPARQQTLRAAFDWSYDLLDHKEKILFRRLSVLAGWSLEMAEQVCADASLPAAEILDLLTSLADKSLVELEREALGQARFRMLETVREYAAGLLNQSGEAAAVHQRRRAYTLREVEQAAAVGMAIVRAPWSARADAIRRFDLEAANLAEMLGSCLADGDAETGLRICTAMSPVWIIHGTFTEGISWIERLLARGTPVTDAVRGRALACLAQLVMPASPQRAGQLAATALELCRAAGETFWVGAALNLLTEIALHAGQLEEAGDRASEALEIASAAGDRWNEGYALGTLATVAAARGNLSEAQQRGESALAIMRAIEQLWGLARTLLGLADLARLRGDLGAARERYLEALTILRDVSARPEIARSLAGLGRIALEQRDLLSARQHLAESLRLSYASGSRIGMARGLEILARLAILEGDPGRSLRLAGAVAALREQADLPPMPGARRQRFLDAAAGLGEHAVARLWAEGAGMTPDAAVRLALGEQAVGRLPSGPPPTGPTVDARPAAALTPREHEVVSLLAAGLSNREIASRLFISPATAARHVANILAKLEFSSRSQVAAWAVNRPSAGQLLANRALTDSPS